MEAIIKQGNGRGESPVKKEILDISFNDENIINDQRIINLIQGEKTWLLMPLR
ncbi:MAG: hypothetical protein CM1200mP10_02690 [Candidatus Neomarinimicrobiota bacterium]|nr:MAG: hypothetical protein CM1200mP10_02690 [Candidatus Neomarinimicrobiota bacterium]